MVKNSNNSSEANRPLSNSFTFVKGIGVKAETTLRKLGIHSGRGISELQDILGHSSPNTTRIYAKNDITKLRQSYSKMHPLNNSDLNL